MAVLDILPDCGIETQSMMPVRRAVLNRSRGRAAQLKEDPFYHWTCDFEFIFMNNKLDAKTQSAMMKIGPGGNSFLCYDLLRCRPLLENNGVPLTVPTGLLATITDSLNVTVSGLQVGFRLSDGDYIEFRNEFDQRQLTVIGTDATANGSGVVDLVLNYPLDVQNFPTGSIVNFEKPACVMKRIQLNSRSVSRVHASGGFSAEEVFGHE